MSSKEQGSNTFKREKSKRKGYYTSFSKGLFIIQTESKSQILQK